MLFTKHRSVASTNKTMPMITTNVNLSMMPTRPTNANVSKPVNVQATLPRQIVPNRGKGMWGPAIWLFFHTAAEKLKPEYFATTGKQLISHIITICSNLPCPECAMHASKYMEQININNIQSKEDLIKLLFVFHNQVNVRIGHAEFDITNLREKYESAQLIPVYNQFIRHFGDKHHIIQMMADDMFRQRICKQLTEWLRAHINDFES
jgi:hypothetical protein